MAMILANVRTPDEREGDLTAQIAANRVGETRLRDIVREVRPAARRARTPPPLQDYTERVLRDAICGHPGRRLRVRGLRSTTTGSADGRFDSRRGPHRVATGRRWISPARDPQTDRRRERELRHHAVGDASTRSAAWSTTTCSTTPASPGP